MIKIYFTSCDGCRWVKHFKSLKGARKAAQDYVGKHPELGSNYAVSGDGIGKVQVSGASLPELFPAEDDTPSSKYVASPFSYDRE